MSDRRRPEAAAEERRRARAEAARRRRERARAGLRRVTLWLPDVEAPSFAAECRRQSLLASELDAREDWLDAWLDGADHGGPSGSA